MSKIAGAGGDVGSGEAPENGGQDVLMGLLKKIGKGAAAGGTNNLGTLDPRQQGGGGNTQFNAQPNQVSPDYYAMLQPQQPRLFR